MPRAKRNETLYRQTEMTVPVENVQAGDLLHGIPIRFSEPHNDFIWRLQAETDDEDSGIELLMTMGKPITVVRDVPLGPNQCISCGNEPVKYAAKRLCSRCYQRQHRETARKQSPLKGAKEIELPFPP